MQRVPSHDYSPSYEEIRAEARKLLRAGRKPSIKVAAWIVGLSVAVATVIATVVGGRGEIPDRTLIALVGAVLATPFLGFAAAELQRTFDLEHALDEVLKNEQNFEAILVQLREERDGLQQTVHGLMAEASHARLAERLANTTRKHRDEDGE